VGEGVVGEDVDWKRRGERRTCAMTSRLPR